MKYAVNQQIIDKIIKPLNLKYNILEDFELKNYKILFDEYGRYYFVNDNNENSRLKIIELSNADVYKLDCFESAIDFKKIEIEDNNGIYAYFKLDKNSFSYPLTIEDINLNFVANKGMNHCDLNLLIPCKTKKGITDKDFITYNHELSLLRANGFAKIIKEEFGNEYFKKIVRYLLGEVNVIITDKDFILYKNEISYLRDKSFHSIIETEFNNDYLKRIKRFSLGEIVLYATSDDYKLRGFLELAYHDDTRLSVLEIYIPNVSMGANKILDKYLADKLYYKYNDKIINSLNDLLSELCLRAYGRRRSMVFCESGVDKREIINTLANEECPMGKIGGKFEIDILNDNIAIYDTAEVYVSIVTMIEVLKTFEENYRNRLEYEVLETFFVELILFEDAAMDKIYKNLLDAQNVEINKKPNSNKIIDKISFDMAKAKRFADFESINFPTVRESAYRIAKKFGIDHVYEKYNENKNILQEMIEVNKRKVAENEDDIKNNFLFLLSAISLYEKISGVFNSFVNNIKISYALSLCVVTIAYILYRYLLKKHREKINEQN